MRPHVLALCLLSFLPFYSTSLDLPEWGGQRISMLREEDAWVDENGVVHYFAGPQEKLWLIRSER